MKSRKKTEIVAGHVFRNLGPIRDAVNPRLPIDVSSYALYGWLRTHGKRDENGEYVMTRGELDAWVDSADIIGLDVVARCAHVTPRQVKRWMKYPEDPFPFQQPFGSGPGFDTFTTCDSCCDWIERRRGTEKAEEFRSEFEKWKAENPRGALTGKRQATAKERAKKIKAKTAPALGAERRKKQEKDLKRVQEEIRTFENKSPAYLRKMRPDLERLKKEEAYLKAALEG